MTGGKVQQNPYFVGLFHTSTPPRSVELSKKWRNSGFHGQGWTWLTYMWLSGAQIHDPALTESPGNSGTIQSRKKYGKGVHLLCMNIIIRASSRVCISHSISSAMNFWSTTTGSFLLAEVPHSKRKLLGKRETSASPPCVFYHPCTSVPKQAMTYSTICNCCW